MNKRNDNGKTVKKICKIRPSYKVVGRGNKQYRCIQISLQLVLSDEKTAPAGLENTLRIIHNVNERAIQALAEEFLPE